MKKSNWGSLIALLLLVGVLAFISPDFRSFDNIISVLRQSANNGLIAFGMTLVILTGGIDLSVGSILALSVTIAAQLMVSGVTAPIAIVLALLMGTLLGAVNGLMVTKGRLQPFIATLITLTAYSGITFIISNGKPISNLTKDDMFSTHVLSSLGRGYVFGIPTPIIILAVSFICLYFLLHRTIFGRRVYAVGSNAKAAAIAGVNITKTKLTVYAISGFFSSLSGLILLSRLGSAQPTLGAGYELDAIAAVALGGTSLSGGRGKIFGTLIGVLIIAVLNNGLNIINVSSYYQDVIKGLVILTAVLSDKQR
ncbi:ribose ABC transporter permease [Candidatus Epulonipiscium fishelsonii]|uniref:Ribose ABC transporter permease n=1 Tax=Candidatus Epulonipiscium fishelsonii TaxID=77094 RepID=A0ACC8XBD1_9FIRM|nr:ribose ABC transporter permease [Epulopiscium sp. SCG-B11WGA-EpuloA1]ONI43447.1 ribose ABC transporter permease [Epulopiscium sp. SCG-B05WGA-EpuloA1]